MLQATTTPQSSDRDHALVIGASIAGLLAAKVLAEHFGRVTLLDRDVISTDTTLRRGAPQGHHPHYLLERGALAMEELFPGLRAQMSSEGVPIQDFGEAMHILLPYGWAPVATTGVNVQSFSRPFLERHLRERVLKLGNVELIGDFCVDGLTTTGTPPAVIGVNGRQNGTAQVITADLIVDASGRNSKLPDWLASIGLSRPAERTVEAEVSYTTRPYEGQLDNGFTCAASLVYAPDRRQAWGVVGIEHGRSLVTLCGAAGETCPTTEQGFAAFADQLPIRSVPEYVTTHAPCGPFHRFIDRGNRWRLLHRQRDWPAGLIALGDTVCVFNPIYGQGLTVAALHALALRTSLKCRETTRKFQRRAAKIIRTPWLMATSADLAWKRDGIPLLARAAHWYLGKVLMRIPNDPDLYRHFVRVQHMRAAPTALLGPGILCKVLITSATSNLVQKRSNRYRRRARR
jgi:2-polyprenyl-6-methoxyphenol hydroxylase-like FAD-dependent oxidoreductase